MKKPQIERNGSELAWPTDRTAALLDISTRRLQQLVAIGVVQKLPSGRFGPFQTANAYIRFLRDCAAQPDDSRAVQAALRAEQLRETRQRADKIALENAKARGSQIDAEVVYKTYENVFVVFRNKVLASSMTDQEKDELLNDLYRLKTRDLIATE